MATLASRLLALGAALAVTSSAPAQQPPQRLSAWLSSHLTADSYLAGTSWFVPEEEPAQRALKEELLRDLELRSAPAELRRWIGSLPVTGRVPVIFADPRWLLAHPDRDPVLLRGHRVLLPSRPTTVTVVTDDGARCAVTHSSGSEALAYVDACSAGRPKGRDWAWVVQPDGRVERYGIAIWNHDAQDEPAPGAWIWAPARDLAYPGALSERLAHFLASQGPAPDSASEALSLGATPAAAFAARSRTPAYHTNDWGETGLLQTPSARTRPSGEIRVHTSHVWPYLRGNVFASPFDWLEVGFRYTTIANRPYGPANLAGDLNYKDKSVDAKFRIWQESAYIPDIAVGFRDVGGTGLFSSEYVVGSKRFGPLDASLGLAWGYAGGRGNVRNPLRVFSERFETRPNPYANPNGGTFSYQSYFRGPTALFGGLQYQTPWEPLVLIVEREGNDYRDEPLGNSFPQRTPWNFGMSWRMNRSVQLSAGVERGNRLMVGIAFSGNLAEMYMPKTSDPPRIRYSAPPRREPPQPDPDWQATALEIGRQTGWRVGKIERSEREVRVTILDAESTYWAERADRAAAVLNRDAPAPVERFVFVQRQRGIELAEHVVERDAWAAEQTRPVAPHERLASVMARPPEPLPGAQVVAQPARRRLEHALGPDLSYTFGSPDAFVLYQIGVAERARFWIRDDTWARASVRLRVIDNYDRYRYSQGSDLPRVRTFVREYATTSRLTMPNLQVTHAGNLTDSQYYSVYAGYFEEMFGGVGTEWLYRPFASRLAFGVDINHVRQRDFEQDFSFMDYHVTTGHATLYADTGWNDVLVTASAGRYLAGDWGGTLQLSRVFRNGVVMGAFATRTNAGARYGEGSFDKGIVVAIPFDAVFTRSTGSAAQITWRPLLRDGGAKLIRADPLYNVTRVREGRALWYEPAAPSQQFSITPSDPEPKSR